MKRYIKCAEDNSSIPIETRLKDTYDIIKECMEKAEHEENQATSSENSYFYSGVSQGYKLSLKTITNIIGDWFL